MLKKELKIMLHIHFFDAEVGLMLACLIAFEAIDNIVLVDILDIFY